MKVLVIGHGGREHALVKALSLSPSVTEVHALPGSEGMRREALCHPFAMNAVSEILTFCRQTEIDLIVIGPDQPIADGLGDQLRAGGFKVFGPGAQGGRLEASKSYAKDVMREAGLPTARSFKVTSVEDTLKCAREFDAPYVLKADGLALGKGVVTCETLEDLEKAAEQFFVKKVFGPACESALLEEYLHGWELSFLILTNGREYQSLALAQDHKRLLDNNQGANTGGMGCVAPLSISLDLRSQIEAKILTPLMTYFSKVKMDYRGVLYLGLMITKNGPQVLEFNARFGDPEAQVILPLLDGDWGLVFKEVAEGKVPLLKWKPLYAAAVVLASPGYPESPRKGIEIHGEIAATSPSSYFIHAGTQHSEGKWKTSGGRVLNAVGLGSSEVEALANAYNQAKLVNWEGLQLRTDIGRFTNPTSF